MVGYRLKIEVYEEILIKASTKAVISKQQCIKAFVPP